MYAKNKRKIGAEFALFLKLNSADNSNEMKALQRALRRAIENELTQRQQAAIKMYFFEDLNMTEIAEILGVNKSTVSRHVKSATERLRKSLKYAEFALREREDF